MKDKNLHPIFADIMDNFTGKEEQTEKEKLRDKIIANLKELDPERSVMADAISHAVNHHYNFENVVHLIIDQAADNPDGMIHVIGNQTLGLILKYSKL